MAELTQQRFAALLKAVMKAIGIKGIELARRMKVGEVTISRYRRPTYIHGPPSLDERRALERAMGFPRVYWGYLDGKETMDVEAIAKAVRQGGAWQDEQDATTRKALDVAYADALKTLTRLQDERGMVRVSDALAVTQAVYAAAGGVLFLDRPDSGGVAASAITSVGPDAPAGGELEHVTRHRGKAQADVKAASQRRAPAPRRTGRG